MGVCAPTWEHAKSRHHTDISWALAVPAPSLKCSGFADARDDYQRAMFLGAGWPDQGGVVQGRSAVGDRSASNQKHEPQPQLSVLLVLGSSCRRNITSPIDQSQSVIQSFSHLVTQSFDQSSSEYVMVIIISAKRRTRARLVSILFKPKVGRSTRETKNSKPLVPEGGHWVETRGKALPFSRNQSAFRWNPQVLPVDLWILISET